MVSDIRVVKKIDVPHGLDVKPVWTMGIANKDPDSFALSMDAKY